MTTTRPAPDTGHNRTTRLITTIVVIALIAVAGSYLYQTVPSSALPFSEPNLRESIGGVSTGGATGKENGALSDRVSVFDETYAGVKNLDSDLLAAVREAATEASRDGVDFYVNSGWRSPSYQERLLTEAVADYGSEEEAARWVATGETSLHVSGDAIDIGRPDAASWLSEFGVDYGLCQIYGNEPWHYELRPDAIDHGCPTMYADPTHDPRLQK